MATLMSCLIYVITLFLTVLIEGVESETCPVHTSGILTGYQSCGNGCCGRYPNYYCCDISTAAVAGIILGGIVVIYLLVFICAHCLKKKKRTGTIVRPVQPATSNTIVFTGSSGRYPTCSHMAMPPPYKRFDSPPPYAEQPGRNTAAAPPGMGTTQNQYGNPPGTQPGPHAYPYGMRPMGNDTANPPPPGYSSSAAPSAVPPAPSAVPPASSVPPPPRQYGYGQNHGWSESSGGGAPNSLAASSGEIAANSSSSSSASAAAAATSSLGPNQNGIINPNRNTITTRNFPSRLPPLPND